MQGADATLWLDRTEDTPPSVADRRASADELQLRRGYPRPFLRRDGWVSLNGPWEFALDPDGSLHHPQEVDFSQTIQVPFSPEAPGSGIGQTGLYRACWYRRTLPALDLRPRERVLLHFGAVDYRATIWMNDCLLGTHEGGYTPFTLDVTTQMRDGLPDVVTVRAEDDPTDLTKPRGKQDWQLNPHSIWYPRTTGIWQTVWLERVPPTWIGRIGWLPNLDRWELDFEAHLEGETPAGLSLQVELFADGKRLAADSYAVLASEVHRRIALPDPGIDDYRNELLWKPSAPRLIDGVVRLVSDTGQLVDEVKTYTALRSVGVDGDRFTLNGRPYILRLVLDQGYWPEGGLTAPDDAALRRDVELVKAMGFNGVRKHQKVEDPRYLYWADKLGMVVWEEMPSAYRFTKQSIERVTREWLDILDRDHCHPCIVVWVPLNESWGVPNLPSNESERNYVRALYHLTKTLDPSRPVVGNDGWESIATDIIGIHDYDVEPARLAKRYHADDVLPRLLKRERPGGRLLVIGSPGAQEHPVMLTEFGGIALSSSDDGSWGYSRAESSQALAERYVQLLQTVRMADVLSGFCYTQFADTYQETNGLLYADRRPKFPLEVMAAATAGELPKPEGALNPASRPSPTPREV